MIKCFGFGKLLKQSFIILLISYFGLLASSFVKGEWIYRNVNEQFMSPGSSTYSQKILSSSAGVLEGAGTTKALIYGKYNNNTNSNRFATFWWGVDNKLYGYVPKAGSNVKFAYRKYTYLGVFQGTGFESLSVSQMTNGIPSDNTFSVDTYYSNSNFVNKVSRFAYYMDSSTNLRYSFCWVFDTLDTSICIFNIDGFYDEIGLSSSASNDYNPPISGLSHIPADFDNSLIGTSPWVSNVPIYSGGGLTGPTSGNNSVLTGDYTYGTCTYDQIIEYAESQGMTRNLCYGGLDNRDNLSLTGIYNPIPGTGKMLDDIYGHTSESGQGANDWFMYRRQVYQNPYVYSTSVWTSKPAVLKTYFDFYSTYNGYAFDFNTVYEYCLLVKFSSWGNGNNIYKGQYFKKTCEFIDNGGRDNYGSGLDGKVPNGTNWDGVGNLSGTTNYNNGVNFIQDIFNRLKANFPTKYDIGLGFLPAYIIVFLCAIILFRFISH